VRFLELGNRPAKHFTLVVVCAKTVFCLGYTQTTYAPNKMVTSVLQNVNCQRFSRF